MKYILGILLIIILICSCTNDRKSNTLIVGMELAYPPFEMTDENNNPIGVSVDLANKIGEKLGKKIIIENLAFDGLIPSLKTKKIDLIISSMTATEERAKSIAFSEPYLETGLCLLTSKNSAINSIEDCNQKGITIVVKKGTTGHIYANENLNQAKILLVDKENAAVLEIIQGKADAFIYDQMSTFKNWQENQLTTKPILKPFKKEYWAIGLRQEDKELKLNIDKVLQELREEGFFDSLGDKFLYEQKQAFKELAYPFYF